MFALDTTLLYTLFGSFAALLAFIIVMCRIGWGWLALAFTCFVMACFAIGNVLSELPTAKMFSNDKQGEYAIIGFIIGITGSMIIFGAHATTKFQKRLRDVLFCTYSVIASTIGLYAITGNAHQQNEQRSALIESLKADIYAARHGTNGLDPKDGSAPCQRLPWCVSADLRAEIRNNTKKLNTLMAAKTVTAFDALRPIAALLRVNVEFLAFLYGAFRTLVAMYGMLICSSVASRQFYELTGQTDKLAELETKTDKPQTKRRQTKRQSTFRRFLSKKKGRAVASPEVVFQAALDWHQEHYGTKPTTRSVNKALRAKKMATIDNNAASRIAKKLKGGNYQLI